MEGRMIDQIVNFLKGLSEEQPFKIRHICICKVWSNWMWRYILRNDFNIACSSIRCYPNLITHAHDCTYICRKRDPFPLLSHIIVTKIWLGVDKWTIILVFTFSRLVCVVQRLQSSVGTRVGAYNTWWTGDFALEWPPVTQANRRTAAPGTAQNYL